MRGKKIFGLLGGNRCLAGDTPVAIPGGSCPIRDIEPGDLVYATDGTLVPVARTYTNGPKELWRFHGKKRQFECSLDATLDHKVVAASQKDYASRLVALGDLGTRAYLVRHDGVEFGEQKYDHALLIGLLLGDGSICGDGVQWTCAEPDLVAELNPYIEGLGYRLKGRGIQYYVADPGAVHEIAHRNDKGQVIGGLPNGMRSRLRIELKRLGLLGTKSGTKFIPNEVWDWTKADVAQLLGGLIATDGSVYKSGAGQWYVGYCSNSEHLVEGIKQLLERGFGIYGSTIHKDSRGSYSLTYGSAQALHRFAQLAVPGRKGRLLRDIEYGKKVGRGTLVPLVDREFLGEAETFDIEVAHNSHIFCLSNNLQVQNSGKTEFGSFIATAYLLGKPFFYDTPAWEYVKHLPIPEGRPRNIWAVGLTFDVLRDVIFREKLLYGRNHPPLIPKDGSIIKKASESDVQIMTMDGSILTGKSADSGREKFQSASVDLVWIDEEPEVEIYDECYQRTVDCAGTILLTLTPLRDIASGVSTPWVFDLYEKFKQGAKDIDFVQLSVLDNPFVPDNEKKNLLEKWANHPEEKARLYGDFVQRSGLVYNMWKNSVHCIEPFVIPDDWPCWVSIDPAATGTTAGLRAHIGPNDDIYLTGEYYERDHVVSEHAKSMLVQFGGRSVDFWIIDPKFGAQRNAETHKSNLQLYRESGIHARLAEVDTDYGLNVSREYINATVTPGTRKPKVYVFNDLHNFIFEIEHYVWAFYGKGEMKGLSKEKPLKRKDHLANAFQYLCAMRPRGNKFGKHTPSEEEKAEYARLNSYS